MEQRISELTFQAIVESTPNAIVLVNKEGKIAYINNQTEKLFGYERKELIGQLVEQLIPDRYHKHHPNFRKMFFNAPQVRSMGAGRELFARHKTGSEFPIEIGLNPLVTVEGTLVLASIIDISERKKAEERFRLVVESAPNAMVLVNQKGDITLVNNQTERLFGFARNELIGAKLEILIPTRFKEKHPHYRNSFFHSPSVREMGAGRDLFACRKDGTEIQVEIGLNPIETVDGQMVLASIIDITERKIQEQTIKKQVSELELKNAELEQIAYIASHDLQEPLRTISNFSQILEEDYGKQLDEQGREFLKTIERASTRMRNLVRSLLDFSRLGRDRQMIEIDCGLILKDALKDLQTLIEDNQALIKIPKDLPKLFGFETEIRQLFQNLINNAIKYVKPKLNPELEIRIEEEAEHWHFTFEDNGMGIEKENYTRIFNIFQRTAASREQEGYGIGLANCKKIVELHGGKIWVESSLGNGSTFHFTLKKAL